MICGPRVDLLPVGPLLMDAVGGERSPYANREKAEQETRFEMM